MIANVYVDGFNLYYGAVKGTPYRWLDLAKLCALLLPRDSIHRIRYYTALVRSRPGDPGKRTRQLVYLRALQTIPHLSLHYGHYLTHPVRMPLATNPAQTIDVLKTEEKGSDVNLATHLLWDGFRNDYEIAIVLSNDSDLVEPIRIVQRELRKPVGILNPQKHPSVELRQEARFFKTIRAAAVAASQFPTTLTDAQGTFHKPKQW
jgi:hypothetical protein